MCEPVEGEVRPAVGWRHRAEDDALAAHAQFLQAKYAGELREDDPRFDAMAGMIPELSGYYTIMRHHERTARDR